MAEGSVLTEEEVRKLCKDLENSLLAAVRRGDEVYFSTKLFSRPVFDADGGYGACPVDAIYTGNRFIIEVGEPAKKRRQRHEQEVMALRRRLGKDKT